MTISCPACNFTKEAELPPGVVGITCPKCRHKFKLEANTEDIRTQGDFEITQDIKNDIETSSEISNLTLCPECSKQISKKALSCPHCGYPLVSENQEANEQEHFESVVNPCRECGKPIPDVMAIRCPSCGIGAPLVGEEPQKPVNISQRKQEDSSALVITGYVLIGIGFFVFGFILTPVAFVIGIINTTRGKYGHGIAQIFLSIIVFLLTIFALIGYSILNEI